VEIDEESTTHVLFLPVKEFVPLMKSGIAAASVSHSTEEANCTICRCEASRRTPHSNSFSNAW
jgi:hypothetical protein